MPAARLTASSSRVADAVLAILAGSNLADVAAVTGMNPDDIADAVQTYHAAGAIALEQRETARWHEIRARPGGRQPPELTMATVVGPLLDTLVASGASGGWWYMNKPPGWRIRQRDTQPALVTQLLLDDLTAAGTITARSPPIYEPEAAAFGGTTGMDIAHDLFWADTSGILAHVWQDDPPLGRRELSILLSFAVILVAEFGDLTQIATASLAARYDDPLSVGAGAVLALRAVAALAIAGAAACSMSSPDLDHPRRRHHARHGRLQPRRRPVLSQQARHRGRPLVPSGAVAARPGGRRGR